MTVIVWDGITLAADRQITDGGLVSAGTKLFIHRDGSRACAFCGSYVQGMMLKDWYLGGAWVEKWPGGCSDTTLIVLDEHGCAEYSEFPVRQPIELTYAWGSGRDYAIGAMAMGATATQAVGVANRFSNECGFGLDEFKRSTDE